MTAPTIVRASASLVPRLVRGTGEAARADGEPDKPPELYGYFSTFNEWATIRSERELGGRAFLERVSPGAFTKTFREDRERMRVLLSHGRDVEVGDRPIARILTLREDARGAYYEARLFDGVPKLVLDGLRAGQWGASFRFRVDREHFDERPGRSAYNEDGIPERSILEATVYEFGPVVWAAYAGASAGVRSTVSLTDHYHANTL